MGFFFYMIRFIVFVSEVSFWFGLVTPQQRNLLFVCGMLMWVLSIRTVKSTIFFFCQNKTSRKKLQAERKRLLFVLSPKIDIQIVLLLNENLHRWLTVFSPSLLPLPFLIHSSPYSISLFLVPFFPFDNVILIRSHGRFAPLH